MKFNWGTGITVFLILFLLAAAFFIGFAMRQDVELVHEDYYERGVDYSEQMNVHARSASYQDSVRIIFEPDFLDIKLQGIQEMEVDSGHVLLFRPSSSSLDVEMPMDFSLGSMKIPGTELSKGRYILKLSWYANGLKYEIDKAIDVP